VIAPEKFVFQVSQDEGQSCGKEVSLYFSLSECYFYKKINARWWRAPLKRTESISGRKALFFTTEGVSSPEKGFFSAAIMLK